jgi:Zn-finger nucleic acid-binding protein
MDCPACGRPMDAYHLAGLEVDRCVPCGVVWFDATELKQFLSLVDRPRPDEAASVPDEPPPSAGTCPRCRTQPLDRAHWHGIPLAICDNCSGILMTNSALAAVRRRWAPVGRRASEFQLPLPEGWDDMERKFVEIVIGGLMGF